MTIPMITPRMIATITPVLRPVSSVAAPTDGPVHNNNLGDNCIQKFNLGRYIVGYTVGNLVLRQRASGAVKRDFRTYI